MSGKLWKVEWFSCKFLHIWVFFYLNNLETDLGILEIHRAQLHVLAPLSPLSMNTIMIYNPHNCENKNLIMHK